MTYSYSYYRGIRPFFSQFIDYLLGGSGSGCRTGYLLIGLAVKSPAHSVIVLKAPRSQIAWVPWCE